MYTEEMLAMVNGQLVMVIVMAWFASRFGWGSGGVQNFPSLPRNVALETLSALLRIRYFCPNYPFVTQGT